MNKNQDFSEQIKLEVKKKAMFRCCRCQAIDVDVHHILPKKDGGTNSIDNAAPLCPTCHDQFGDNPNKRKVIKQMRNNWYEKVEAMYPTNSLLNGYKNINDKLEEIKLNQKPQDLDSLKKMLIDITIEATNNMTIGNASAVASNFANASGASLPAQITGGRGGNVLMIGDKIKGNGAILVDGGDGIIGGNAGTVEIHASDNQFKGTISAKGGKGKYKA